MKWQNIWCLPTFALLTGPNKRLSRNTWWSCCAGNAESNRYNEEVFKNSLKFAILGQVSSPMLKSQLVWQLFSFSWAPHLRVLKRRWRLISTWRGSSWSRHDIFIATLQSIMKWKPPIALVQELETQVELYKSKEARKLVAEVRGEKPMLRIPFFKI